MSQMLILHLIYFPEKLVSGWKYYRLVSQFQEKKYIFHTQTHSSVKLHQSPRLQKCLNPQNHIGKWKTVICSIDPESVRKSPLIKQKILDVYADVFKGLGTSPGEPCKIKLKEFYMPARHAPRKVLIRLQDNFHQEINDLVKQGVLEKVEHFTEWVNLLS